MPGKARVHQLAKELGLTSKEVLTLLNQQGTFVKSASSTVEAPAARRLRAAHENTLPTKPAKPAKPGKAAKPKPRQTHQPRGAPAPKPSAAQNFTGKQADRFLDECRRAYAAGKHGGDIHKVCLKYAAQHGVSERLLRQLAEKDRRLRTNAHRPLPKNTQRRANQRQQPGSAPTATVAESGRTRERNAGLPSLPLDIDIAGLAAIIDGCDAGTDERTEHFARLQSFGPAADDYGYLAWRYAAVHHRLRSQQTAGTIAGDLGVLAKLVDGEKQLLKHITNSNGAVLDDPGCATQALKKDYADLITADHIGSSAQDELRRVKANNQFLRRAVVLTIAGQDNGEHLWNMLPQIRPPTPTQLIETTPDLHAEMDTLATHIAAVEALLTTSDASLERFYRRSHSELVDLQCGRFDFLAPFRDAGAASSGLTQELIRGIPHQILPQGANFHRFLDGMRSAGRYRGSHIDPRRLTVLEQLREHFGAARCQAYAGTESSEGVNNQYLILAITSANSSEESAVAISPIAGEHAAYVVRPERSTRHWATIFANPKLEARRLGARRLVFTDTDHHPDKYSAMRDKVITLLECRADEFANPFAFDEDSHRYRMTATSATT